MPTCLLCDNDAVMFCANCGKPICNTHTIEARYCSVNCYNMHKVSKAESKSRHNHSIKSRASTKVLLGVAVSLVMIILAIWFFWYGGI